MNRARKPFLRWSGPAALAVLLMIPLLTSCSGSSAAGGLVLGQLLGQLTSDVQSVIQTADNSASGLENSASANVQQAIDNATSAYDSSLNQTVSSLTGVEASTVDELQSLVQDLSNNLSTVLMSTIQGAQQITNTLPFAHLDPQVTTYTPQFTAASSGSSGTTPLTVSGNFYYNDQSSLTPTISVGGLTLHPVENTTQQLGFSIPNNQFPAPASGRFSTVTLVLTVPYKSGLIFQHVQPGVFRLLVTALPTSPVTSLTLTNTTNSSYTETQQVTKPPSGWYQQSNQDCTTHTNVPYQAYPDPGWTIDTGVVPQIKYLYNKNPGEQSVTVTSYAPNEIVIQATTIANCFLGESVNSGDINFQVSFTEQQTVNNPQVSNTPISLNWGDQLDYFVNPGWEMQSTLFNGTRLDFTSANNTNPYLSVGLTGSNSIQVSAPSPAQVASIP